MLFNSLEFLIFITLVFPTYWALNRNLRIQNTFVLMASYLFYGWWDWRFLSLIIFSSLLDFFTARSLGRSEHAPTRRALLGLSLVANLGLLGVFKYYNFFAESLADALSVLGVSVSWTTLAIVLPVGISFYTFQTLSYTIDVYRRQLNPSDDLVAFLAYVSFFPQLVAGPIERATQLLPQFQRPRTFDETAAVDGLRQILWGLFKKVVVADTCGAIVDDIFANYGSYSGLSLLCGAVLFAMQIYCDFSGYSDIAIGTARLLGFNLMRNFAFPYFSRDIGEFWRRWHISLSTWFRDYVYIPLGGNRGGLARSLRNITIVFLVSGLWHGANWTFLVWGALHASYFLVLYLRGLNRANLGPVSQGRLLPTLRDLRSMLITFGLTVFAWIFFRAESVSTAFAYVAHMIGNPHIEPLRISTYAVGMSAIMLTWEWIQRDRTHGFDIGWLPTPVRHLLYVSTVFVILSFAGGHRDFIYFQF